MHKKITYFGIATAIVILAVCIGTATAYSNYDAIWTSSGNQFIGEDTLSGIAAGTTPTHSATHFYFMMAPSQTVNLMTPFVNSISKSGIHPKVRYLYYELNMPTGVNVVYIYVNSGTTNEYFGNPNWAGTGAAKDYTLDLGSYHDMVRGIYTGMVISNSQTSNQAVGSYGAGAKQEW